MAGSGWALVRGPPGSVSMSGTWSGFLCEIGLAGKP